MAFSIKMLKAYATSPQGKKLLAQAKKLDTPQNREKAKELVSELRKRAEPAAKKAVPTAKAAAKKVTERKKVVPPKPQEGPDRPPA
jgi:F0F1-type ATP synthase membrane subunit b/b'